MKKAAEDGEVESIFNLGKCYFQGEGVEIDKKKDVELYERAVSLGDASAMNNLGYCYQYGEGVTKHMKKTNRFLIGKK